MNTSKQDKIKINHLNMNIKCRENNRPMLMVQNLMALKREKKLLNEMKNEYPEYFI